MIWNNINAVLKIIIMNLLYLLFTIICVSSLEISNYCEEYDIHTTNKFIAKNNTNINKGLYLFDIHTKNDFLLSISPFLDQKIKSDTYIGLVNINKQSNLNILETDNIDDILITMYMHTQNCIRFGKIYIENPVIILIGVLVIIIILLIMLFVIWGILYVR